jgi:hypothetical protein
LFERKKKRERERERKRKRERTEPAFRQEQARERERESMSVFVRVRRERKRELIESAIAIAVLLFHSLTPFPPLLFLLFISHIPHTHTQKQTFPETLYRILDDVANGNVGMHLSSSQASKMISWEEMGKGFKIYQPKEFNAMILPIYAKRQTRYRSFQRQLNIYGFKMNKKSGIYHHDYFTRGDILSLKKIRPSPNKNHIKNNCRKSNIKNMITTTTTASSSTSRVAFDAVEQQQRVLGRSIVSSEEEYDSSSSSGCSTTPLLMRKLPSSIFSFSLLPNDTITITGTGTGTGTGYNMMPIIATGSNANADALEDIDVTNISKNIDINTTNAITVFDDLDFLGWR